MDDFVLMLQTKPLTMFEVMQRASGAASSSPGIDYLYALSVFYKQHKNPNGPSARPIFVFSLEQANYGAVARQSGVDDPLLSGVSPNAKGEVYVGQFSARGRANLGAFDGNPTRDQVRDLLFSIAQETLRIKGTPVRIGAISDIHGHPETGWPARKKSGCFALAVIASFLIGAVTFGVRQIM